MSYCDLFLSDSGDDKDNTVVVDYQRKRVDSFSSSEDETFTEIIVGVRQKRLKRKQK